DRIAARDAISRGKLQLLPKTAKDDIEPPATRYLYDAIRAFLEAAGKPQTQEQITQALLAKGWAISPKNDYAVVPVSMRRRPKIFEKVGRKTWALTAWP